MHPPIDSLQAPRVIQKRHRQRIGEHTLSRRPIIRDPEAGQGAQRSQVPQAEVTGDAEHGCIEIMRGTVDPGQKGRQLELADLEIEPGAA